MAGPARKIKAFVVGICLGTLVSGMTNTNISHYLLKHMKSVDVVIGKEISIWNVTSLLTGSYTHSDDRSKQRSDTTSHTLTETKNWKCCDGEQVEESDTMPTMAEYISENHRSGNRYMVFANLFSYALKSGCAVKVHPRYFDWVKYNCSCFMPLGRNGNQVERLGNCSLESVDPSTNNRNSGNRFLQIIGSEAYQSIDAFSLPFNMLFGNNRTHALGKRCTPLPGHLAIKVRAGDQTGEGVNVHQLYGQPPIDFYRKVLNYQRWSSVIVICETMSNPVCPVLKELSRISSLNMVFYSDIAMHRVVYEMTCAANIADSVGTMGKLWSTSPHLRQVFTFSRNCAKLTKNDKPSSLLSPNTSVPLKKILAPFDNTYLQTWRNSPEQRKEMMSQSVHFCS